MIVEPASNLEIPTAVLEAGVVLLLKRNLKLPVLLLVVYRKVGRSGRIQG